MKRRHKAYSRMDTAKSCSVTLRIASRDMEVDEITSAMGVAPSESHSIGDVISSRSPTPRFRCESLWLLVFDVPEERPLEEHIDAFLTFAEQKKPELSGLSSKCDIEAFCCFSTFNGQGGYVLNHTLMQKMSATGIDFVFDLYLFDSED